MHALALGADEGAFEMDAENAGNAGIERRAHGFDRFRHGLTGIGDEGRQQPGGAIGAVGLRDGPDALDGTHVVVENAAAAIDLHVDEAGSEEALNGPPFDSCAEILLLGQGANAAVLDDDGAAVEHVRPVEDPGTGQGNGHQRVSVTLRRRGGLSGLRPRPKAVAFTRG